MNGHNFVNIVAFLSKMSPFKFIEMKSTMKIVIVDNINKKKQHSENFCV